MIDEAKAAGEEIARSPWGYSVITYLWVIGVSSFGGIVSWWNKRRDGQARPYNVAELLGEILTSALVGLVTFWLCEYESMPGLLQAPLIAIAGHMGTRALFLFEKWAEQKFPVSK